MIAEAVEQLPEAACDLAGNALLNIAAEADDVGCPEAGQIFSRRRSAYRCYAEMQCWRAQRRVKYAVQQAVA
jgi:hypothetical protein